MKSYVTISTLGKGKKLTLVVLLVLLVILVVVVTYDIKYKNDFIFFYFGLIYLGYSFEYVLNFILAYDKISFHEDSMVLMKKRKTLVLFYTDISSLNEIRNNFIEMVTTSGKKYLTHGEFHNKMEKDNSKRTVNIIAKETHKQCDHVYAIIYK